MGGEAYFANGDSASRGVAILFKRGLDVNVGRISVDPMGQYVIMHIYISVEDENYCLGNIYAPTQQYEAEQIETLNKIEKILVEGDSENILLGADFNIQLDPQLDRKNSSYPIKPGRYRLEVLDMVERLGLVDIWRVRNPVLRRYSFLRRHQASGIDMWLVAEYISGKVGKAEIIPGIWSNHSIVSLEISLMSLGRGPGWWKFNNCLLKDKQSLHQIPGFPAPYILKN